MSQNANAADAAIRISDNVAKTTDNIVNLAGSGTARVYEDASQVAGKTSDAISMGVE